MVKLPELVDVSDLEPMEDRRFAPKPAEIKSYAENIQDLGILQNLVARPHPTDQGKLQLVAGRRRLAAARLLRMEQVPVLVREMDDHTAVAISASENIKRTDLHPLEHAGSIDQMMSNGWTFQTAAKELGMSPQWVARRWSLINLTEQWKNAIVDAGSPLSRLSASHYELIARMSPEAQNRELTDNREFWEKIPSIVEAEHHFRGHLHLLHAMPWALDDATLVPRSGSCLECKHRSSRQPLLWDEEHGVARDGKVPKNDRCLNPRCYREKQRAFVQLGMNEVRRKHGDVIPLADSKYNTDARAVVAGKAVDSLLGEGDVHIVRASEPGAKAAYFVHGAKIGREVFVIPNDQRPRRSPAAKPARREPSITERRKELQHRRDCQVAMDLRAWLERLTLKQCREIAKALEWPILALMASVFGVEPDHRRKKTWTEFDRIRGLKLHERYAELMFGMRETISRRAFDTGLGPRGEAERFCRLFNLNIREYIDAAERKIPEPPGWTKEEPHQGNGRMKRSAAAEAVHARTRALR